MKILLTGAAGFIGYHVAQRLIARGDEVVGLDDINDYYDVRLKYGRLEQMSIARGAIGDGEMAHSTVHSRYRFVKADLANGELITRIFKEEKFDRVCHLAAQAGVRYSLVNPQAYVDANIVGFVNILEACRHHEVEHLVYASSSSVYGLNEAMPFSTRDCVDHPVSLYAASKKSNELMAHCYSHLFGLPTTGLRFFTVYGPWGRPDMALSIFTKAILEGNPIEVFNHGDMQRDFTYIDDIVEGIVRVIDRVPEGDPNWSGGDPDPSRSRAPYRVYNIGNSSPVKLMDFIAAIEQALGKKAELELRPMQPGDVPATWADVSDLEQELGYKPGTPIEVGVQRFVEWYREFYGREGEGSGD